MFERRRRGDARPFYLISAAGLPNYGDEFITRAWLDWLAANHPTTPVWLDCVEPGRANHLFSDAHPLLRTTNTLWHMAIGAGSMSLAEGSAHASRLIVDLGSPRFDLGLLELREARSVHLLGGGYMTSVWENQLVMLPALTQLKARYRIPIYATGQGLAPLSDEARALVSSWARRFDFFEARDAVSAKLAGVTAGVDDAFLGFANRRSVYSSAPLPELMLMIQGDFVDATAAATLVDTVERFVRRQRPRGRIGLVESIPPDDSWIRAQLSRRGLDVDFFSFLRLWQEGFPAQAGQTWLSTRFHFHLLAAAAGAQGAAIELHPEYYGAKHASLRELGTGWSSTNDLSAAEITPSGNPDFSRVRQRYADQKVAIARSIYG